MNFLLKLILIGCSAMFAGCSVIGLGGDPYSAIGFDPYKIDPRKDAAILRYYKEISSGGARRLSEFKTKTGTNPGDFYLYAGDKMLHAESRLVRPEVARGNSIADMDRPGNEIYAIPIMSSYIEINPPKMIEFWIIAVRENKLYMIGLANMRLSDFRGDFKREQN